MEKKGGKSPKKFLTLILLSILVGIFGIDSFYLGKIGTGILKFITIGGFGIWYFIDLIIIATGNMKDAKGRRVTDE